MSTTDGTNGRLIGQEQQDQELPTKPEEGLVSPGSSATGGGTSQPAAVDRALEGTSEADVSDGSDGSSEQKQQPVDEAPIVDVAS